MDDLIYTVWTCERGHWRVLAQYATRAEAARAADPETDLVTRTGDATDEAIRANPSGYRRKQAGK